MKVLLIDVNYKNSSTGNIVYSLYNFINSSGDEAAVCYGRGSQINEKNIYKFGLDIETYAHALLTRLTGYTGCFSFFSTQRLIKYIKNFKPDVVHIHELHAYFVNIKPLINYLKKNHIRTIMTLHCEFAYTGKCGHSVECEQWKSECKKCPHLKDYVSTRWFDHTNYMFNQKRKLYDQFEELTIVTPSEWSKERAKVSILKDKRIVTIHNGVDETKFYPRNTEKFREKLGVEHDEKIILSIAPHIMSKEKGGSYLIEIAKKLQNQKIRVILVGADDVSIKHEDNTIVLGAIYDKDLLAKYYSLADVFVICSKKETFSMTCAEAIMCGTPVAGFKCGAPEKVFPKEFATFVDYGDVACLQNEIVRLLDWKERKSTHNQVEFSIKKMCEDYSNLYKEVLEL